MHSQLEIQYGGLQGDFDNLKAQLDEEAEGAAALKSQLQKSQAEYQTLKSKYDKEISARTDEIDELRSVIPPRQKPLRQNPLWQKPGRFVVGGFCPRFSRAVFMSGPRAALYNRDSCWRLTWDIYETWHTWDLAETWQLRLSCDVIFH